MSLKSFDNFCAKIVNNDPIQQKEVFDERQKLVRSHLTIRALWAFVIAASANILVMECGPQWCESTVLSTAIFGAAAYLYWVLANARRDTLFGIGNSSSFTAAAFFADGIMIPIVLIGHEDDNAAGFFFRNGQVSENLLAIIVGVLLIIAAAVMMSSFYHHQREQKNKNHP